MYFKKFHSLTIIYWNSFVWACIQKIFTNCLQEEKFAIFTVMYVCACQCLCTWVRGLHGPFFQGRVRPGPNSFLFYRPGPFEKLPVVCWPGPARCKNYLSSAGPAYGPEWVQARADLYFKVIPGSKFEHIFFFFFS